MYIAYLILLGIAIVSNSFLIGILYLYSQKIIAIISFIILLIFLTIWIIPIILINTIHAHGLLFEHLNRLEALGYVFSAPSFVVFTLAYTKRQYLLHKLLFWLLLLIPPIIYLYLSWSSNTISVHSFSRAKLYPWGYETPIGRYFSYYLFWFESLLALGLYYLIIYYRSLHEFIPKRQALFVLLSIAIPLGIGTITNGVLPVFNIYVFPSGALLSSVMSPIIVFAIIKYGLFEVTPYTILSNLNHSLITIDQRGRILQMNTFSEKMLGVKPQQVVGTSVEKLLQTKKTQKSKDHHLLRIVKQVLDKGKSLTVENYVIMDKKQRQLPVLLSVTPVFSQNKVIGANILMHDIRKEKSREKQKDDFINMLSHELKTPITSIKAYDQLLLKQFVDVNDRRRELIVKLDTQVDRLNRLIQDFFEVSRVHSGKMKLHVELFNIDKFISDVVDTLGVTYPSRKISIQGKTDVYVYADKDKITQTIINLVTNAIKYSPPNKEIVVLISTNTQHVTIGIRDFGKGIAPKFRKHIFDQFYQIENTITRNTGLGIGLFIANHIVKLHGGKMWVDSITGKGSTFYFTLPVENKRLS